MDQNWDPSGFGHLSKKLYDKFIISPFRSYNTIDLVIMYPTRRKRANLNFLCWINYYSCDIYSIAWDRVRCWPRLAYLRYLRREEGGLGAPGGRGREWAESNCWLKGRALTFLRSPNSSSLAKIQSQLLAMRRAGGAETIWTIEMEIILPCHIKEFSIILVFKREEREGRYLAPIPDSIFPSDILSRPYSTSLQETRTLCDTLYFDAALRNKLFCIRLQIHCIAV